MLEPDCGHPQPVGGASKRKQEAEANGTYGVINGVYGMDVDDEACGNAESSELCNCWEVGQKSGHRSSYHNSPPAPTSLSSEKAIITGVIGQGTS